MAIAGALLLVVLDRGAVGGAPLYPDLVAVPASGLYFDRVTMADSKSHYVLRFSTTLHNVGEGRLELQGDPNPNGSNQIYQNLYDRASGGTLVSRTQISVDILYHPSHYHYHLQDFAGFRLLQRDENGAYQPTAMLGTKSGFCILDYLPVTAGSNAPANYSSCGNVLQGLSAGWGDTYVGSLPEQWIDLGLTALPAGFYAIETTIDPADHLLENGREGNNVSTTYFYVNNGYITIGTATSGIPSGATGKVVNTGGAGVYCRATPGGTIITTVPEGTTVQVTGATANGWVPVICASRPGWISSAYLRVTQLNNASVTPTPTSNVFGTVMNTGGAPLACRATANGTVIAQIPAGSSVPVRGALKDGWYPVVCDNQNGWVQAIYLMIDDGTSTMPPAGQSGTVINTNGARLNCRATPNGTIITTLAAGSTVPVTGTAQAGWVPVICGNRSGWVSAAYLRITNNPTYTPGPTSTPTITPTGAPATVTPTLTQTAPAPSVTETATETVTPAPSPTDTTVPSSTATATPGS